MLAVRSRASHHHGTFAIHTVEQTFDELAD
jgi:hypothetical protein